MNAEESQGAPPLLELRNVDKSYRGTKAVSGANLLLGRGEILGLVGENGAGKSTVSGIMSGLTRHDSGELLVEGEARSFRNPVEAQHAGISRIAQEISLVPQLTVAENVFLGNEQGSQKLRVSRRRLVAQYRELLDELELTGTVFDVDPRARVDQLSIADFSLAGYLFYPKEETGYDFAQSHPNIHRWTERLRALPGWKDPYDMMPGQRIKPFR